MILIRSFLGRGIFSTMFTYLLYTGRIYHLNNLAGHLDPGWRYRWHGPSAASDYYVFMQRQAYLTAAKELTGGIILAGLAIVLALIIWTTFLQKDVID
jgi:hypothetical protein